MHRPNRQLFPIPVTLADVLFLFLRVSTRCCKLVFMPRTARVVIPGLPHHVIQRGNRRMPTFFSDDDYRAYRSLLAEGCRNAHVQVVAYCLMPNQVHLVLVPSSTSGLRDAVAIAHRKYAAAINGRHGWRGHLWQERFHSLPLQEDHILAAVRYVELVTALLPPAFKHVGPWVEFLGAGAIYDRDRVAVRMDRQVAPAATSERQTSA